MHTSLSACLSACHQLSHARSRQRRKLTRDAPVIRLSRWALTTSMLGDDGVHFDPAA